MSDSPLDEKGSSGPGGNSRLTLPVAQPPRTDTSKIPSKIAGRYWVLWSLCMKPAYQGNSPEAPLLNHDGPIALQSSRTARYYTPSLQSRYVCRRRGPIDLCDIVDPSWLGPRHAGPFCQAVGIAKISACEFRHRQPEVSQRKQRANGGLQGLTASRSPTRSRSSDRNWDLARRRDELFPTQRCHSACTECL